MYCAKHFAFHCCLWVIFVYFLLFLWVWLSILVQWNACKDSSLSVCVKWKILLTHPLTHLLIYATFWVFLVTPQVLTLYNHCNGWWLCVPTLFTALTPSVIDVDCGWQLWQIYRLLLSTIIINNQNCLLQYQTVLLNYYLYCRQQLWW